MRRVLRFISVVLIICLMIPSSTFGQMSKESPNETNVNGFMVTTPEEYDFNMALIGDIDLSKKITLRASFGEKLKGNKEKVRISLSKGIHQLEGDLKFNLDAQTDYKDIGILVKEYGEYYITISVGDKRQAKEYTLEIYENYATYGPKGNKMVFENLDEAVKKLKDNKTNVKKEATPNISIKKMDKELKKIEAPIEDFKISKPIIEKLNTTGPILEESSTLDPNVDYTDVVDHEENTVVDEVYGNKSLANSSEKTLTLQDTVLSITSSANSRGLVASDIVPKVAPPYLVNTQYPFEFMYGNESSTSKSNVKIGLYVNETQIYTFTTTLAANSYYKLSVNLGLQNPGVHELRLQVDENYTPSIHSKEFLWAAKTGKAVEFNVGTSQSQPHIVGKEVPFNVSIRNVGTEYTGTLSLRVYDNLSPMGDFTLVNIAPGYTVSFTASLTIHTPGSHTIRFVLDPDRVNLPDYYAQSYTATWKDITDIRAKSVSLLGTTRPKQMEDAQVRVEIANEGTIDINSSFYGTLKVRNRDNSKLKDLGTYKINGIAAGTTIAATITFKGPERGRWDITNTVDSSNYISEDIETNNQVTTQTVFILPIISNSYFTQLVALSDMSYESYNPEYILRESGLSNWQQIENESGFGGFKYIIMKNTSTNEYVIAFAGSSDFDDYVADINEVVLGLHSDQVIQAENVVKNFIRDYPNAKFAITGHSLGGYLAAWTAALIQDGIIVTNNFTKAYTFNAPGIFQNVIIFIRELSPTYSKITNFVIRQDYLVGNNPLIVCHLGNEVFFESQDSGLKTHYIYQFYRHDY